MGKFNMQLEIKHNIQNEYIKISVLDPEFVGHLGPDRGEKSDSDKRKYNVVQTLKSSVNFQNFMGTNFKILRTILIISQTGSQDNSGFFPKLLHHQKKNPAINHLFQVPTVLKHYQTL